MSDTRKAVITTDQVREALEAYKAIKGKFGKGVEAFEFDKGARGKGFAVYNGDAVVRSFETKEDAFVYYNRYVEVATEVLDSIAAMEKSEDSEKSEETPKPTTRRKAADKPAE